MPTNLEVFTFVDHELQSRVMDKGVGRAAIMREGYPVIGYMDTPALEAFAEQLADLPAKAEWQPPVIAPEPSVDDMPPGPFTYETIGPRTRSLGNGHVYILDANGRKIASMWGKPAEKLALAELICNARGE